MKPIGPAIILALLPAIAQAEEDGIAFRFGLGPSVAPGYFGDAGKDVGVTGSFELERFKLGGLSFGGEDSEGLGFGGSVRYIGARDAEDYSELEGLETVDPSLELGGGLSYTIADFTAFANVRYGVIGHEAFVAEVGGDYLFYPREKVTMSVGPRAVWGDDTFAQTYFGVTDDEALASAFDSYDAGAGLVSAGVAVEATYAFNDDWELVASMRYDRLQGDAADSPLTESDDQLSTSVVLTRRFSFDF